MGKGRNGSPVSGFCAWMVGPAKHRGAGALGEVWVGEGALGASGWGAKRYQVGGWM